MAIAAEQGRIYRSTINGLLTPADGARLTFQLREMRCTREAINAEAEAAAKRAPVIPSEVHISIGTVPSGCYLTKEAMERLHSDDLVVNAIPLSEYTRQAAAAEVEREIDAAVGAAAIIKPEEPAPEEVEPLPPMDQDEIDRANGFEFSYRCNQHRRPQPIPPKRTQRPPSMEDYNNMSTEELMRRAGVAHVDQD